MCNAKFYLILLSFLFTNTVCQSQSNGFKIDCGNDTVFCASLRDTSFYIGTQLKLTNGNAPYKYKWSCKPIKITSNVTFTASDFLNDTCIANPYIKDFGVKNKPWRFYLAITDKDNNVATDSINIQISSFIYKLLEQEFNLHLGDSFQFFDDIFVGDGISPVQYYWTPTIGLEDSSKVNTWCKPLQSTIYSQYIIDSAGCESNTNRVYQVNILPTSIDKIVNGNSNQLNLYQSGNYLLFNNKQNRTAHIVFYSSDGKTIHSSFTNNSFYDMNNFQWEKGLMICIVTIDRIKEAMKFIK